MLNNKGIVNKIGIFDSGIGGLTVARAINELLPSEKLLYIGDTAHSPWGDKSRSQIIHYTNSLIGFLLKHNCNIIVIACNTASCVALEFVVKQFPNITIFNVIDPTILYLAQLDFNNFNNIGIIGTKQTISSKAYKHRIEKLQVSLPVTNKSNIKSLATPLLVPLIEEGWIDTLATDLIIEQYLSELNLSDQSILILGCTHYPILKQQIQNYYLRLNKQIMIIDSNLLIATQIKNFLQQREQLNINPSPNTNDFYCTSNSEFFFKTAKQFFANISLNFLPLWE